MDNNNSINAIISILMIGIGFASGLFWGKILKITENVVLQEELTRTNELVNNYYQKNFCLENGIEALKKIKEHNEKKITYITNILNDSLKKITEINEINYDSVRVINEDDVKHRLKTHPPWKTIRYYEKVTLPPPSTPLARSTPVHEELDDDLSCNTPPTSSGSTD